MGNSDSNVGASVNVCFVDNEAVFNMQQNTFANYMLLDIRTDTEYNKSHIDCSNHLKFASKLSSVVSKPTPTDALLHKKWLKQLIKLHQSSFSKSKITFYIVDDHGNDMHLVKNVCNWLTHLDSDDDIRQIDTSCYYYLHFSDYKTRYSFMCSDHQYYEEGRLFPTQITPSLYLSNWGIASDGFIYKILNEITSVINCTRDHPNVYSNTDSIHCAQFLSDNEDNPMFKRQSDKIEQLREEFSEIRLNYLRVPVTDTPQNDVFQYFDSCCKFIEEAVANDKILIHCRHGQSRSVTVVAAWLIYSKHMTVEQSLQFIKAKRPRSSPNHGFIQQLEEWAKYRNNEYIQTIRKEMRSLLLDLDLKLVNIDQVPNIDGFADEKGFDLSVECTWQYIAQTQGTLKIFDIANGKDTECWQYEVNGMQQTAVDAMIRCKSQVISAIHGFIKQLYPKTEINRNEVVDSTDVTIQSQLNQSQQIKQCNQAQINELQQMQQRYETLT
eukprot:82317_1